MTSSKTIVVLGATGNQGGSVVNTYLQDSQWKIRAVTRNVNSEKAKKLASRGVEVVSADLGDPTSLEKAFTGANAIFIVSDFWGIYGDPANSDKPAEGEPLNLWAARTEKQQLLNAIKAASDVSTLERLVLSALPNCSKWSNGKYTHVYHFDFKAQAAEYAAENYPDLWAKTSVFNAGWFMTNYTGNPLTQPRREDGIVKFTSALKGDLKLPLFVADEDTGPLVKALLEAAPGKNLIAYREWMTLEEMASVFTEATGLAAKFENVEDSEANLPLPDDLKTELRDNWKYFNECGYEARENPDIIHPSQLEGAPKLGSISDWIKKQNWDFVS
ncbi:NmrA-like family protein [Stagonosporopsis vannaccii]|nr:NmrA-like family protein [Stagonosporopsis vannaccii]